MDDAARVAPEKATHHRSVASSLRWRFDGALPMKIISRKEAKKKGLSRYYTGKSCKNGHFDEREVDSGGCISCARERQRKYYWKNPEQARQRQREWFGRNKESAKNASKKWRENNPKKYAAQQRRKYLNNKYNRIAYIKKWKQDNYDNVRAWNRNRKALKKNAEGRHTRNDIADLMSLQKGRCAYCEEKLKKDYHVDHIVPISKGGANDKTNLAISCVECNLRKGSKTPEEWAQENGRLL